MGKTRNKDKVNPNISPATTKNKQEAALKAIGLWNDDPEKTTSREEVIRQARAIREGSWERKK